MNVELTTDVNPDDFVDGNSSAIPLGFKHTELGASSLGWTIVTLGQIVARTQLGGNYKNSENDTGQPLIKMGNLGRGFVKLHKQEFIIGEAAESDLLSYGDVLFNTRNTLELVGKVAIWKNELPKAYFNSNLMRISFKDEFVSSNIFMNALMNTEKFIKSLSDIAIGTTSVAAIYNRDLLQIKLVLPTKEEQTAIANALSDVDALIQELEKLIAKKQAIKTATMQQLLTGRTRLPQFAHHPDGRKKGYKPSELGEIPEDWEVLSLGTASSFSNGRAYALHEWETAGTPVIRLQNLTGRGEDYYYSNMQLPERQYCQEGDLLFMWSATFGPVIWKGPKAIYHYHIWKIICNSGFSQAFMLHLLDDMTEKLKSGSSSGGTMLHVTKHKMETTKAIFPVFQEQAAIGTLLDDMDEEICALEYRLNKTRQIKQGMMQELLTGKTRLVKPACAA